jgi:creatinine amidohydrolase/Fe(II)-dependent formamide hydrolase-like protein
MPTMPIRRNALPWLALVCLWQVLPGAAHAASASTPVLLEAMTSPELAARVAAGATTILIPIGGTEQNGPYMTLGKHNVRALLLATRIAEKLGNAIVAPVIAYVPEGSITPPAAHMRYSGTITIPDAAFEATLASTAESFRAHGFRDIVFLGDHGGYQADLVRVTAALDHKWAGSSARAHAIPEYYRASTTDYERILARHGVSAAESGSHAGLADTSLMLALDPSTVRSSALAGAPAPTVGQGVHGDPRHASAELGALGVDAIVNTTVAAIRAATVRH